MQLKLPFYVRLLRFVLKPWLKRIPISDDSIDQIQAKAQSGKVIFFMRKRNWIDFLVWQSVTERANLELESVPVGIQETEKPESVATGSFVFLESEYLHPGDVISCLLKDTAQNTNVYLFPITILWQLKPRSVDRSLLEILFRPRERARWYRRAMWVILGGNTSRVVVADAIELHAFAKQTADDVKTITRKVRLSMRYHIAREERAFLGPRLVPRQRLLERAIADKKMKETIETVAQERGIAQTTVRQEAHQVLDEIAADYRWSAIRFLEFLLSFLWSKIYEDFDIDDEGLDRIREASKTGPVILVPTHKSHMDYLIISYLFKRKNFVPPHIAAGINLSFFPVGNIFRRCGAFFIRRSFLGDKIYESALKSYMKILLRENYSIEFFIEGTRSRSGKIMPPKFGMLTMLLEAQNELPNTHVKIVPISIDYESLFEESSMVKEAQGAEKKEESVTGILSARRKLGRKYGKVYVRFGHPQELRDIQDRYRDQPQLDQAKRVAYDVLEDIQECVTVTASAVVATAVCVHHKRGIRRETLLQRTQLIRRALLRRNVHLTSELAEPDVDRALGLFERNKVIREIQIQDELVYTVDDSKRMALDYYKNNIVHFLTRISLASLAFRISREDNFEHLWQAYDGLQQIFVEEFHRVYTPPQQDELRQELNWLEQEGLIKQEGQNYRVIEPSEIMAFENVTRNFLESAYIAVMSILENDPDEPKEIKDWLKLNGDMGELLYAKGDIWRAEARSKINLNNALNSFRHKNLLISVEQPQTGRRAAKPKYFADEAATKRLDEIRILLQKILVEVQLN